MHKVELSPEVMERAIRRRGEAHPFKAFDPKTAALIVVDMQNGFVDEAYSGAVPGADSIVPNINQLAAGMRAAGGHVVWIQNSSTAAEAEAWDAVTHNFMSAQVRGALVDSLTPGTPGFELYPALDALPGELRVAKNRFSAFIQDSSDLEVRLREKGVDTVLITGTVTNVCCESTARDAAMRNFKVIMVADANAARSDADHNATLNNLFNIFADVLTTNEIVAHLETVSAPARRTG